MPNINTYLFLAIIAELTVMTIMHEWFNSSLLPILHLLTGLLIIVLAFKVRSKPKARIPAVTLSAFILLVSSYIIYRSPLIFEFIPIDVQIADMLPVIEVMGARLLNGHEVYAPITEIWNGIRPIYLPALWLPSLPFNYWNIDPRWVGTLGLIALVPVLLFQKKEGLGLIGLLTVILPTGALILWHTRFQLNVCSMSNEGLVFFYYALLCFAIVRKIPWLIGLALTCCLLSRYYIGTWALMMVVIYYFQMSKSAWIELMIGIGLSSIVLLSLGQAWNEIDTFIQLPRHYLTELLANPDKYQTLIDQSLSLARYVDYENSPFIHSAINWIMWAFPILGIWYYLKNKDHLDVRLYALGSMKLVLVLFFSMMIMPYHYLFFTSFIISLALAAYVSTDENESSSKLQKDNS